MKRAFWTLRLLDAEVIADLLRAEGMPAFVFNEGMARMSWWAAIAYGGYQVMVADEHARQAADVVGAWQRNELRWVDPDPGTDDVCPRCEGHGIGADMTRLGVAFVIVYMTGLPVYWPRLRLRCQTCAYQWRPSMRHDFAELSARVDRAGSN